MAVLTSLSVLPHTQKWFPQSKKNLPRRLVIGFVLYRIFNFTEYCINEHFTCYLYCVISRPAIVGRLHILPFLLYICYGFGCWLISNHQVQFEWSVMSFSNFTLPMVLIQIIWHLFGQINDTSKSDLKFKNFVVCFVDNMALFEQIAIYGQLFIVCLFSAIYPPDS